MVFYTDNLIRGLKRRKLPAILTELSAEMLSLTVWHRDGSNNFAKADAAANARKGPDDTRHWTNVLSGVRFIAIQFEEDEHLEAALHEFFESKRGTDFYRRGIEKLPKRWYQVVFKNGDYLIS